MSIAFPVNQAPWAGGVVGSPAESVSGGGAPINDSAVVSVEYLEVSFDNEASSTTADLSKGQVPGNCVPFITTKLLDGANTSLQPGYHQPCPEIYDNSGTAAIRLHKKAGISSGIQSDIVVGIFVVEYNPDRVSVQHVSQQSSFNAVNKTLDEVVIANSFVVGYHVNFVSAGSAYMETMDFRITSTTNLRCRNASGSQSYSRRLDAYVVEDLTGEHWTVQHGEYSANPSTNNTASTLVTVRNETITSVGDLSKAMCLISFNAGTAYDDNNYWSYNARLTSVTNLQFRLGDANISRSAATISWQVVTFLDDTVVQRGSLANYDPDSGDTTQSISAVDLTKAIVKNNGLYGMRGMTEDAGYSGQVAVQTLWCFNSDSEVGIEMSDYNADIAPIWVDWEVIQWD